MNPRILLETRDDIDDTRSRFSWRYPTRAVFNKGQKDQLAPGDKILDLMSGDMIIHTIVIVFQYHKLIFQLIILNLKNLKTILDYIMNNIFNVHKKLNTKI